MGEPFMLALPPDNPDTGPWAVYSCLTPCRAATLTVAGTRAEGVPYESALAGTGRWRSRAPGSARCSSSWQG